MARLRTDKKYSRYSKENKINKLTDRDMRALNSIYNFRCLSFEQLFSLNYKYNEKTGEINADVYAKRKLAEFIKLNLITEVKVYDKDVPLLYQLTMEGINVLRKRLQWPNNLYDEKMRLHVRGYLTESELNVKERIMAHQYNQNKFVLNLMDIYKDSYYKYEDEKHLQSFVGIRPDGVFTVGNISYFIEMDMGTETTKKLQEKWNHYREFMNSQEYICRERRIIVLFIVEGVVKINQRISLIKNTINTNFIDCFSNGIEMYINTPDELLNTIREKIIPESLDVFTLNNELTKALLKNDFKIINDSNVLKKYFNNNELTLFARKNENSKILDLVFENAYKEPMSSIYKALFFEHMSASFKTANNTDVKIILVFKNEKIAYRNYLVFGLSNVLFTTFDRIQNLKLEEAIFSLDKDGNIYTFNDSLLNGIVMTDIVRLN